MQTLKYECATNGDTLYFEGPVYGETMPGLRGRAWSYTTGLRNLSGVNRSSREISVDIKTTSLSELDRLRHLSDADMANNTPGKLIADEQWEANAYIVASEPQDITPDYVSVTLTIILLEGLWRRWDTVKSFTISGGTDTEWLDLPCDLPADLMGARLTMTLTNPQLTPMPWRLIIYGPASNPYIQTPDNTYEVDVTIPDGGYLTIDSVDKTVILTASNGDTTDCFGDALRGTGKDGGTYIFQPLPAGTTPITWPNSFNFDMQLCEEESEPPWT